MQTANTLRSTLTSEGIRMSDTTDPIAEIIAAAVCEVYAITQADLVSTFRYGNLSDARHTVCHIMRVEFGYPYKRIARELQRDHTTVIHSVTRASDLLTVDPEFRDKYMTALQSVTRR